MRSGLLLALLLAFPASAQLPSPECQGTPADPAQPLEAISVFKMCAPTQDVNGDALDPNELTDCSIVLDGTVFATVPMTPGMYVEVTSPTTGPKHRQVVAFCTGPAGNGPTGPTYTAHVRQERPGKPGFK